MITLKKLIHKFKEVLGESVCVKFDFPAFYIIIEDDKFSLDDADYGENVKALSSLLTSDVSKVTSEDILSCLSRNSCNLIFGKIDHIKNIYGMEYEDETHWLSMFDDSYKVNTESSTDVRAIHFYGNKGGQARSSFLATLANFMQAKGLKVLVVDVDVEAPTMHLNLGIKDVPIEASLLNYCEDLGFNHRVVASPSIPNVDLISCRPSSDEWDADYISFCLKSTTMPDLLNKGVKRIKNKIISKDVGFDYDVVLFDHRTGASHSVMPVVSAWPGTCVIFTRPDNQTIWLSGIRKLLSFYPENPGVFVSFDMDHKSSNLIYEAEEEQRENLLSLLSNAMGSEDGDYLSPDELEPYYLKWVYDRAYLGCLSPEIKDLQRANVKALEDIYEILDVNISETKLCTDSVDKIEQSISGVRDETWFVESVNSKLTLNRDGDITYILGRKGTGKSRLFEQAILKDVGIPLIAPSEYEGKRKHILTSATMYVTELINKFGDDYQGFWWFLFYARILNAESDERYFNYIKLSSTLDVSELKKNSTPISLANILDESVRQVLLIDGLETIQGIKASKVKNFVSSLISCISVVNNNSELSSHIKVKLFVRVDLLFSQNVEQQLEKRSVDLTWSEDSQLNFNLACIAGNANFKNAFPEFHQTLLRNKNFITSSGLSVKECEDLLLVIFPLKLRRSNLKTITFLKTYFRDASSATQEHKATFYPRLFLNFITELGNNLSSGENIDSTRKISHGVINAAYETAASKFLQDIKQELSFAIDFDDDFDENARLVESLLHHFQNRITPFELSDEVGSIFESLGSRVDKREITQAMYTMKNMGIFEQTLNDADIWRAGRVYKSALRMKYLRRKS